MTDQHGQTAILIRGGGDTTVFSGSSAYHCEVVRSWILASKLLTDFRDGRVPMYGRPITVLSRLLRGWCGYFDQGPVMPIYDLIRRYIERRVRRWLMRRTKRRGVGFTQISDEHLYETLGLYRIPARRSDLPRAKA